jgi:hypothetical protein
VVVRRARQPRVGASEGEAVLTLLRPGLCPVHGMPPASLATLLSQGYMHRKPARDWHGHGARERAKCGAHCHNATAAPLLLTREPSLCTFLPTAARANRSRCPDFHPPYHGHGSLFRRFRRGALHSVVNRIFLASLLCREGCLCNLGTGEEPTCLAVLSSHRS